MSRDLQRLLDVSRDDIELGVLEVLPVDQATRAARVADRQGFAREVAESVRRRLDQRQAVLAGGRL